MEVAWYGSLMDKITAYNMVEKQFSVTELDLIFSQVLSALAYVHAQKVCHRDIKPHNIIFRANGEVLLIDFGTAKVLGKGDFDFVDRTTTGK